MITKEMAMNLKHGDVLYHTTLKNADGTPMRARVNGRCKTWKRNPEDFSLPMKHGLRDCFYLDLANCGDWSTTPQGAVMEKDMHTYPVPDALAYAREVWNSTCDVAVAKVMGAAVAHDYAKLVALFAGLKK